jgi:hypothetical protein
MEDTVPPADEDDPVEALRRLREQAAQPGADNEEDGR